MRDRACMFLGLAVLAVSLSAGWAAAQAAPSPTPLPSEDQSRELLQRMMNDATGSTTAPTPVPTPVAPETLPTVVPVPVTPETMPIAVPQPLTPENWPTTVTVPPDSFRPTPVTPEPVPVAVPTPVTPVPVTPETVPVEIPAPVTPAPVTPAPVAPREVDTPPATLETAPDQDTAEKARKAAALWEQMRRADVGEDLADARMSLAALVSGLTPEQRVPVATAMMDPEADEATAATPLTEFFGRDGLPLRDLAVLMGNEGRTFRQRVLLRTCFKFLRPEYETELSEATRRQMLGMIASRLTSLAVQEKVSYGEQRLLTHMVQSALSRYAGQQEDVPQMAELDKAMQTYAVKPRKDDILAVSISAWVAMANQPAPKIDSVRQAIVAMGHWDPLVREKAAAFLGKEVMRDPSVGETVFALFEDSRDEVRAAAATVFSFAIGYEPKKVVSKMVELLVWDEGVIVQKAASDTLVVHSEEATGSLGMLLDALETRVPLPGPRRTGSILQAVSYLVSAKTPDAVKKRVMDDALTNLDIAPRWALKALEVLGPFAKPAVGRIREYRNTQADRFLRQAIDRHVLTAIDPTASEEAP